MVLLGVFGVRDNPQRSLLYVILGAILGFLPSAWTVVMPLLSVALIVLTIEQASREDSVHDGCVRLGAMGPWPLDHRPAYALSIAAHAGCDRAS